MRESLRQVRVESSDVIRKPVDALARRVTMPAAWWSKPIPEQQKSVAELEATAQQITSELDDCRRLLAKKDKMIERLRIDVATLCQQLESSEDHARSLRDERDKIFKKLEGLTNALRG